MDFYDFKNLSIYLITSWFMHYKLELKRKEIILKLNVRIYGSSIYLAWVFSVHSDAGIGGMSTSPQADPADFMMRQLSVEEKQENLLSPPHMQDRTNLYWPSASIDAKFLVKRSSIEVDEAGVPCIPLPTIR